MDIASLVLVLSLTWLAGAVAGLFLRETGQWLNEWYRTRLMKPQLLRRWPADPSEAPRPTPSRKTAP